MGQRTLLVTLLLLSAFLLPLMVEDSLVERTGSLDERAQPAFSSSNYSVSPSEGWTTGGETLTITGTGFLDMAFQNVTSDGEAYTWTTTTANYVTKSGLLPTVAVDSNGTVHIVHVNWDTDQLWHSTLTGGSWNHDFITNCYGCRHTDMVVDSNDNLHVAYYLKQESTTGYLYYAFYNGTDWTTQSLQNNIQNDQVRIALDANDRPHISYSRSGYLCNGAMLKYHDGSSWATQTLDTSSTYVGCDSSIAIDSQGFVHVTYRNHNNMDQMIVSNVSGQWQKYTVDGGSGVGYYSGMTVDHDDNLHILYRTNSAGGQYKYATGYSGTAWSKTASSGSNTNFRMMTDDLGNIHGSLYDGSNVRHQMMMPGQSWQTSTVDSAGDVGRYNDIFVDHNNMIHIAYYDSTNELLKYANKSTGMYLKKEITVDFGAYGMVTGTVVDDTTIVVETPSAGSVAEAVNLSLWGTDGTQTDLGLSFLFIAPDDLDMDGFLNPDDDCPNVAGTSTIDRDGCPDADGDGYSDENDDFPNNPSEWQDIDGDGVGDNSDLFPNDSGEWSDSDGDGAGDNGDAFPYDASETTDSDNDGVGDNTDMFPYNPFEYLDSDGDGVGDNSDAFPFDANETMDSDGDGYGDNTDVFPNDSSEWLDSDGDGIGDNSDPYPFINNFLDSDGDSIPDLQDAFPNDMTQWMDSDGDGYGDNATGNSPDAFVNLASQWSDIDGDGYGDNWGNASWNDLRSPSSVGEYSEGALMADFCPQVAGNSTAGGFFGCADDDGDGVPNMFEIDDIPLDSDGDGIPDEFDECPDTPLGTLININGCELVINDDGTVDLPEDSFFSGELAQTVGWGAIILALLTLLQTNAAAAVLPDAFRWVQVFRRNTNLTREEVNELTYLQSLVQAYFQEPENLHDELRSLKADLTARFTNNEIKKETREKINVLINDLLTSSDEDLLHIAHNDAYFGLVDTISAEERTELLNEKVAMGQTGATPSAPAADTTASSPIGPPTSPSANLNGEINPEDGFEWLEHPDGSGTWYMRQRQGEAWTKWDN